MRWVLLILILFVVLGLVAVIWAQGALVSTRPSIRLTPQSVLEPQKSSKDPEKDLRRYALEHKGSIERGRELFENLNCSSCHGTVGKGGRHAPRLVELARRYSRAEIINAILEPSKTIAQEYQQVDVITTDGRTIHGRLQNHESDDPLEIIDQKGKRRRFSRSEVENLAISNVSAMPEGLVADLSPEDFADLLAYVTSLARQ